MKSLVLLFSLIWHCCCAIDNSDNACSSQPCRNDGTCVDRSLHRFMCNCTSPYAGEICDEDKNECLSNPCFNYGTCNNLFNAFNCTCSPAFKGEFCETALTTCTAQSPALQAQRILMFLVMTASLLMLFVALVVLGVVFHFLVKVRSLERSLHQAQELVLLCAVVIVLVARSRTLFDSGSFCGKDGMDNPPRMSDVVCSSVAVVLHYIYLVYFLLLVLEAFHNYMLYTYVFVRRPMLNLTGNMIIALYLPVLPVGVTGGLLFWEYTTEETCWLNMNSNNMIIEVIPILLLVATSVVISEASSMFRNFPDNPLANEDKRTSAITNATGMMFIAPLSLFSWVLGISSVHNQSLSTYIFVAVVNGLLAFAIVVFHSMGDEKARALLERAFCGCCPYYIKKMRKARRERKLLAEQQNATDDQANEYLDEDRLMPETLQRHRSKRSAKMNSGIIKWQVGQDPLTIKAAHHTIRVESGFE